MCCHGNQVLFTGSFLYLQPSGFTHRARALSSGCTWDSLGAIQILAPEPHPLSLGFH